MRTLNFKTKKFRVGQSIVVIKTFVNGNVVLATGEIGKIVGESRVSLPDMNLFNIRVLDLEFGKNKFSVGQPIAEEYMDGL